MVRCAASDRPSPALKVRKPRMAARRLMERGPDRSAARKTNTNRLAGLGRYSRGGVQGHRSTAANAGKV